MAIERVESQSGSGGAFFAVDVVAASGGNADVPYVKLMGGADGSVELIDGDAANGIDVDVTRLIPGTSATALGKAEDSAHAGGDTGVMMLAVRSNAAASTSGSDGDYQPLITNTTGHLWVDCSGQTLTVASHAVTNAGTFATQATQSGTWNITNVSGTISLPTGAATAAKQPALGTAGTAATDVITVQGITSMTPLLVTASAGTNLNTSALALESGGNLATLAGAVRAEDVASANAHTGMVVMAIQAATPADTAGTDLDYSMLQMSGGRLWVDASGKTLTVGSHAVTNAGTFVVQENGAALTSLQLIDDPVIADDAAFTPATSKVMMAGFEADETATDSVDEGDAGAARMTLDRKQIVNPQPHTAGGLSIARDLDLDNGTLTVVKNAAGQLYGWDITNTGTVTVYVKFYDAASGTLGTGTPVMTIGIPGNSTDDTLSSKSLNFGLAFATGICVGCGTGLLDNDNTDPGTNVVIANIYYK